MEIRVYLHRTKKKQFEVADCFSVFVDLDKLPEDKATDIDYINLGFKMIAKELLVQESVLKNMEQVISLL